MFVLTCPECGRVEKVKLAKRGASTTCPKCQARYKLDERTLDVEEDPLAVLESLTVDEPRASGRSRGQDSSSSRRPPVRMLDDDRRQRELPDLKKRSKRGMFERFSRWLMGQ